ncbi:RsmB/NOP family class I SAM-dependent RNA methyltransferase [Thalassovita taeanensis]|uniref:16S rRNA (Cytosine967-C5)-methyltransferase n=1 Tax=Thalassovita taeanensis TaxID=657014 RepID=A0A1H8ZM69_9RHOB|nr:RsmB/NOP family class I SAM-dependent RNA methyltransferase [Thalassovita taeanensis]SEP64828.1 16S rRNA (cytosine967-C5)-methyltransferase [Thalassovita taeanensis]
MTPAARIQTAAELLGEVLSGVPAEKVLTSWARRSRFAGSKDRVAVRDHVFDALRCRRSCAALGGAMTGRGIMLGWLRMQGGDPAPLFTGGQYTPAVLSEAELAGGRVPDGAEALDLPDWLLPLFREGLGNQAEAVALSLRERAPVMLRVNLRLTDPAGAISALAEGGIMAEPDAISRTALRVLDGARKVSGSRAYADGLVELQDGASQAVADELNLVDGSKVLDLCAGGGGKTLAMAGLSRAQFYAYDANPQRMRDLPARAERAGVVVNILDDAGDAAPYDLVLCDAPCSGSGAWRRAPEGKWLLSAEGLADLNRTQDEILDRAAGLVAPAGELAYVTCSVLARENLQRIEAFIARNPGWRVLSERQWLPGPSGDGFYLSRLTQG